MERITVYSNKDCAKCARTVRFQTYLNWLRRVRYSTDEPKCGPLRLGEIAVEDLRTGTISKGVEAVRQIYWQLPALWPLLPLLRIPQWRGVSTKQFEDVKTEAAAYQARTPSKRVMHSLSHTIPTGN